MRVLGAKYGKNAMRLRPGLCPGPHWRADGAPL